MMDVIAPEEIDIFAYCLRQSKVSHSTTREPSRVYTAKTPNPSSIRNALPRDGMYGVFQLEELQKAIMKALGFTWKRSRSLPSATSIASFSMSVTTTAHISSLSYK